MHRQPLAAALGVLLTFGLSALARAQDSPTVLQLVNDTTAVPVNGGCGECCQTCCEDQPFGLLLGFRPWFSWANTDDVVGDSLFKFRDNYATIYEFNFDTNWRRLVGRIDLGFGSVDDGTWQEVAGGTPGPTLDLSGDDVFYITADLGYRLLDRGTLGGDCPRGCAVDLLAGYQFWRESYDVAGAGAFFSDEYRWSTLRLGGRAILARNRLTLQGRLMFSPYNEFESSTAGDLNYTLEGDGGWGVFSDVSASYRIWRHVAAELGYQVFYMKSDGGSDGSLAYDEVEMVRHGLFVGINWRY